MRVNSAMKFDSSAGNIASVSMIPLLGWKPLQTDAVRDMLVEPNAMSTFGSEEQDIDWEKEWRSRLKADKPDTSGRARLASHRAEVITPALESPAWLPSAAPACRSEAFAIMMRQEQMALLTLQTMAEGIKSIAALYEIVKSWFIAGPQWMPFTEVDAYVVNIPHAADADDAGIINPLLKRYLDHVCGIKVFGHLAVKVKPPASAPSQHSDTVSSCWNKLWQLDLSGRNSMHKAQQGRCLLFKPI